MGEGIFTVQCGRRRGIDLSGVRAERPIVNQANGALEVLS